MKPLQVHCVQMRSINSYSKNLKAMVKYILKESFSTKFEHLVCFPENCLFFRLEKEEKFRFIDLDDKIFEPLRDLAKMKKIYVMLGSVPLKIEGKNYSSIVWIDSKGKISHPYQKMHLFNVNLPGNRIRESDFFSPGKRPFIAKIGKWKIGLCICFDIRFSHLFNHYKKNQVDAILLPSAFTVPTGKAHWEILLRSRAIENQAYILAPAQSGSHLNKRFTFGHSMIVDPWGQVVEQKRKSLGTIRHVLDSSLIEEVRKKIPMVQNNF